MFYEVGGCTSRVGGGHVSGGKAFPQCKVVAEDEGDKGSYLGPRRCVVNEIIEKS